MPDFTLLALFIPTFFFVSIIPGMCMTLALSLGMSIGVRRTLWMMWGGLSGVALVAISAVIGAASIMLHYPHIFMLLKWLGGAYLFYIGLCMWRAKDQMRSTPSHYENEVSKKALFAQGFVTAIANPKAWAFMISLLPPFIQEKQAIAPQMLALISLILVIEFCSLLLYASGGHSLKRFLKNEHNIMLMNRIAGSIMIMVGIWLALD